MTPILVLVGLLLVAWRLGAWMQRRIDRSHTPPVTTPASKDALRENAKIAFQAHRRIHGY